MPDTFSVATVPVSPQIPIVVRDMNASTSAPAPPTTGQTWPRSAR